MEILATFIPHEILIFFRYSAILGFICVATLVINLNHNLFNKVMSDNAKTFWWLFVIISVVPLLVIIYVFNFFFGGKI